MSVWYYTVLLLLLTGSNVSAGEVSTLRNQPLVDRFYSLRGGRPFWFARGEGPITGRRQLIREIDSSAWSGLDSNLYFPEMLRGIEKEVGLLQGDAVGTDPLLWEAELRFTDAAFSLAFDRWRGRNENGFSYDGVSPRYALRDDSIVLDGLSHLPPEGIGAWLVSLEPRAPGYLRVKAALGRTLDSASKRQIAQLAATLNIFRYIHHFGFPRFIVVNIPSATLYYFSADTLALSMRVVTGQPSKRTPRFAAWCNGLVLYPYWNVPRSIAVHEFLPILKRSPDLAALVDFQVLDEKGRVVDASRIDWKKVRGADFPYTIRQTPGCENALGVLKFELTDPFNVYMHDTNFKRAFGMANRYLSHGCIRLEHAARLGELLLDGRLDTAFLAACLRDQKPRSVRLAMPVPVFVLYLTAVADSTGGTRVYKDIYHLLD